MDGRRTARREAPGNRIRLTGLLVRPLHGGAGLEDRWSGARHGRSRHPATNGDPVSIVEILILVVMVGYAVYRQTQRHEVVGSSRFKLAIIYAVVGLVVGGFSRPDSAAEWGLLAASLALS